MTGPGRPLRSWANAWRNITGTRSGDGIRADHLVICLKLGIGSNSPPSPCLLISPPPGNTSSGVPSANACAIPPKAFSIPGPAWTVITPIFRPFVAREYPSAMLMSDFSVRAMIGRIPPTAPASIRLFIGYPKRSSTPSSFRISTTASSAFILVAPLSQTIRNAGQRRIAGPRGEVTSQLLPRLRGR